MTGDMCGGAHVFWGVHTWQGTCMAKGKHAWQRGCAWQGACVAEGECMAGGGACVAGETAIAAGGTHPTGMHSCYIYCVFSGLCNGGIDKLNTKYEESNCGRPSFGTL